MKIKIDSIDKILRQLTCKVPVLLRDSYVPKEQHFYTGIVLAVMQLGLGVFLISAAFGSGSLILVVVGGFLLAFGMLMALMAFQIHERLIASVR